MFLHLRLPHKKGGSYRLCSPGIGLLYVFLTLLHLYYGFPTKRAAPTVSAALGLGLYFRFIFLTFHFQMNFLELEKFNKIDYNILYNHSEKIPHKSFHNFIWDNIGSLYLYSYQFNAVFSMVLLFNKASVIIRIVVLLIHVVIKCLCMKYHIRPWFSLN